MEGPGAQPESRQRRAAILGFAVGAVVVMVAAVALASRLNVFAPSLPASDPRPASDFTAQELWGRTIHADNCASCHGSLTGGDMMDYPPRHNSSGHTWHHPDCQLKRIVLEGGDEMTAMMRDMMAPSGAPTMQAFKDRLREADIDAVLAYIKTMWTPEQRELQAEVTRESCTS